MNEIERKAGVSGSNLLTFWRVFRRNWRGKFFFLTNTRWLGQFADGLFQSSLATFILFSPEREPNAVSAAVAFAVVLLPYSLVGPFAGALLDRFSRQAIVEKSNYFRFVFLLVIAVLLKAHSSGVFLTLLVLIVFGLGRLVLAGLSAGLPVLVSKENIISLNAISVTVGTLFQFFGIGFGAGIKSLLDSKFIHINSDLSDGLICLIASLAYLFAGFYSRQLKKDGIGPNLLDQKSRIKSRIKSEFSEIALGFNLIRKHAEVGRSILVTSLARGGETALVMSTLLLERNSFNSPNQPDAGLKSIGVALAIAAVGIGVGAIISPLLAARIGRHNWIRISALCAAPFFILIGILPNQYVLYITAFFVGGFCQAIKVTTDALLQANVIDEFRGRIFAFYDIAVNLGLTLGALFAAAILPNSGKSFLLYFLLAILFIWNRAWILRKKYFH